MIKQVRAKIKQTGVTYLYFQFVSVTGRIVGKGIPADHWERVANSGFQLVYGSTANLFVDRHGDYIGYGPESSELIGIADPETFCQLPWDKRIGRIYCTLFRNREEKVDPGKHLTSDCRGNLRIAQQEFEAKHKMHPISKMCGDRNCSQTYPEEGKMVCGSGCFIKCLSLPYGNGWVAPALPFAGTLCRLEFSQVVCDLGR